MKNLLPFWIVLLISCSGQATNKQENYTPLEMQVEKCYNDWFDKNNVDWNDLQKSFEEYFTSFGILKTDEPIEKQYKNILSYISRPIHGFPKLKDKKKIIEIRNKLKLSENDVFLNKQLYCYTDIYILNKTNIDTTSCFYVFGSCFEEMTQIPDISPGLLAHAILMFIDIEELKKPIYQKTIILMYYFTFAAKLSD